MSAFDHGYGRVQRDGEHEPCIAKVGPTPRSRRSFHDPAPCLRSEGKGFLDLIMGGSNQLRGFRRFKGSQLADMVAHPAWKSGIEDLIRKYRWFSN